MKDLDELLREDARAWQPPHAPVPELDIALARAGARRAKLQTGAALVAVVALAAGGVTIANQAAPGIPATPAPVGTPSPPSAPASSPVPSPSPTAPDDSLAQLTDAVRSRALQFGIPAQVEAVRTTWLEAQEFLPASGTGLPGGTEVWVVQVGGEFSCDDCQTTQTGPERSVSTLALVLTADGLDQVWYELGSVVRPLQNLGEVVTLDPDGSTGNLSFARAVHAQAAEFGIPVTAEAVLTRWRQAADFLSVAIDYPGDTLAKNPEVRVVQIRGEFSCDDCQSTQSGPEQSVSVLTLVLDATSFECYYAEPGEVTRPLDQLGVVQAVDLELVS